MDEQDIIKKLRNLRQTSPDRLWREKSRSMILSQIAGTAADEPVGGLFFFLNFITRRTFAVFSQPAAVALTVLVFVLGGSVFSLWAAKGSIPGDSLYIAKIINEKAKLAFTFDEKEKAKLNLSFAGNRAKEMGQVRQNEQAAPAGGQEEKIEKLSVNFQEEIKAVKSRLNKIVLTPKIAQPEKPDNSADPVQSVGGQPADSNEPEELVQVFGANVEKSERGLQVAGGPASAPAQSPPASADSQPSEQASNTPAVADQSAPEAGDPQTILAEAEKLFLEQDYEATISKLEEINALIENGQGEVNGESAAASGSSTSESAE